MSECLLCGRPYRDGYLCPGCTRGIVERLGRMPSLYVALAAFLPPARRDVHGRRARAVEAPLPVSEPVLDLRGPGGMVGPLEDWRSALHADLGWSEPVLRGSIHERVTEAAARLTDNVLWIASSWPLAGSFAEEIRDLERAVLSVINPQEKARRIGQCPTLQSDGTRCGAILRAPHGVTEVCCPWCRAAYPLHTWYAMVRADQAEQRAS
ncbi:hypothetical protein [Streptomyces antimycoticus]|uniref:hypothetical protein n=1 Tax=Streptomyces antimycoticus TaxID=68175 RepID=UPI003863FCB8|nr:hypothetical protein OG751_23080 [Streptomyces antimycoticus]